MSEVDPGLPFLKFSNFQGFNVHYEKLRTKVDILDKICHNSRELLVTNYVTLGSNFMSLVGSAMKMNNSFILQVYRARQSVFTLNELSMLTGMKNYNNLKRIANYYSKKGIINNLRRGFYVKDEFNPYELAVKIYPPSYIGFETVLLQEGVIFQFDRTVTIASYLSREITINGNTFRYRKLKDTVLTSPQGLIFKDLYTIAGKERAFLDILYLNKDFYVDHLEKLDKNKVFEIVEIYRNLTLEKKVKEIFNA